MLTLNLDQQHLLWLSFSLVFALMGGWFGWKYPGHETKSVARQVWTWADIVWLLVAFFTVAKITAPVDAALKSGEVNSTLSAADNLKEQIFRTTWRAQDTFCAENRALEKKNVVACDNLRKIERSLTVPSVDHVSAAVIERDYLPPLLASKPGDASIVAIGEAVERFRRHELDNVRVLRNANWSNESDFWLPYLNLYVFIMALGLRFGRSVAELRRNSVSGAPPDTSGAGTTGQDVPQKAAEVVAGEAGEAGSETAVVEQMQG